LEILDTDKPSSNWLSKLTFSQYSKPVECLGIDAIKIIMAMFDERRNPGFFLIYDLFAEQVNLKVFVEDSVFALASVLLRVFAEFTNISVEVLPINISSRAVTI
jgi:hypothetical protein